MAAATICCRLCRAITNAKRTVHLFTTKGLKNRWASRISTLLEIAVDEDDRLPPYVCSMCTRRLESLENAAADLKEFQELAQCSLQMGQDNPLKRTRVTSGDVGVSPDTAKARPSSKLSRKKLSFECKYNLCR